MNSKDHKALVDHINMCERQNCEQLQNDIITFCDGLDQELIDNLCQVVVNHCGGDLRWTI